jgi:hypothetical protein
VDRERGAMVDLMASRWISLQGDDLSRLSRLRIFTPSLSITTPSLAARQIPVMLLRTGR